MHSESTSGDAHLFARDVGVYLRKLRGYTRRRAVKVAVMDTKYLFNERH